MLNAALPRRAEKDVDLIHGDALRRTGSRWLFIETPIYVTPHLRNGLGLTIPAVNDDQDCRSALLSPSFSALKSSVATSLPAYAGSHRL